MGKQESEEAVEVENQEPEEVEAEVEEETEEGEENENAEESEEENEVETEEGEEEDGDQDEEEGGLGNRAEKRIKKLIGKRKDAERRIAELEQELEEAKKTGGEDGETYIRAAKSSGILPRLMTKEVAEGLNEIERKSSAIEWYGRWLDQDEDECEIGGKNYSRRQIERQEQKTRAELAELERKFGGKRDELQSRVKEIFELGLRAKKAGWTGKERKTETKKGKLNKPAARSQPGRRMEEESEFDEVSDEDDLENAIMAMRRRKK